jgi:hypothetical protein
MKMKIKKMKNEKTTKKKWELKMKEKEPLVASCPSSLSMKAWRWADQKTTLTA